MSVYRVGVNGSWTEREFSSKEKIVKHLASIDRMLDELNEYTDFRFDRTIADVKKRNEVERLLESGQFKEAKSKGNREFYRQVGVEKRLMARMKFYFPELSRYLKSARYSFMQYSSSRKSSIR